MYAGGGRCQPILGLGHHVPDRPRGELAQPLGAAAWLRSDSSQVSGFRTPASHNAPAFNAAVDAIAAATRDLLDGLVVRSC